MTKFYHVFFLVVSSVLLALSGCATFDDRSAEDIPATEQVAPTGREIPKSSYEDLGEKVRVTVYLDMKLYSMRTIEGQAMLQAKKMLRVARPNLPEKIKMKSRVLKNSKNRSTGIYTYCVEYY